ncbi:MAG TPA: DUF4438 domain-containing protein [Mesotoga sp.]|nr:DUF4438 domain-containing protein [Mesotoga sp.]MDI9374695.1 DUF4438 domain-containing protein [Thermotogota bacterium]MDD4479718.1 DUF4438 domain-containing protein [Mesotoga sp.]HOY25188.1 DUF4438 domain-containing protein [Mesotoga sp.]HPB62356.1 DUF4438 domain-containing protein [Mesotoga sp.]
MKTNKDTVVKISVSGEVAHPLMRSPFRLEIDGTPRLFPGTGGITYNFALGDSAFKMTGDHVEPDVSTKNPDSDKNTAYVAYSCIGNSALVISGDAKGERGVVTGKHGGINHVLIHFKEEVKEKMAIGDRIQVTGYGQGLVLEDYPGIRVYNIDPYLLERVPVVESDGKIHFPVRAIVPGYLMGSGSGSGNPAGGDYDIITNDRSLVKRVGLDKLRIGDFVALENHNDSFGLGGYMEGSVTIGVVVHGDCIITGHGPGVTVIMADGEGIIVPEVSEKSNIVDFI